MSFVQRKTNGLIVVRIVFLSKKYTKSFIFQSTPIKKKNYTAMVAILFWNKFWWSSCQFSMWIQVCWTGQFLPLWTKTFIMHDSTKEETAKNPSIIWTMNGYNTVERRKWEMWSQPLRGFGWRDYFWAFIYLFLNVRLFIESRTFKNANAKKRWIYYARADSFIRWPFDVLRSK